jgi:hypothetical protein
LSLSASGGSEQNSTITIQTTIQGSQANNTNLYFVITAPDGSVVASHQFNGVPRLSGGETFSYSWQTNNSNFPAQGNYNDLYFPAYFTIPEDMPTWVGDTYLGLDTVAASIRYDDVDYPLIGYRDIGAGRVWFIGFNILYWSDIMGLGAVTQGIVNRALSDVNVNRALSLPSLEVVGMQRENTKLRISYQLEEDSFVVLSQTYFPRWRATLNGEPIPLQNHANLAAPELPAGLNQIEMTLNPYGRASVMGGLVSIIFGGLIAGLTAWSHRHNTLSVVDRVQQFFDRYEYKKLADSEHQTTICPQCGESTAVIGTPTTETYPFVPLRCEQCGFEE